MAKGGNTDLDTVFGGGSSAAPAGPSLRDAADEAYSEEPAKAEGEAEAAPAEFATHAREAFPDLEDAQVTALYRAIQACH